MKTTITTRVVATLLIAAWAANSASAATILASTSFENETPDAQYEDTGDASVDHDLVNNAGQSPVDSTASSDSAGDLGFDARYENTRGGVGLTDGDFVGVTNFTGTVGAFTDGDQGYQMSDADGKMILTFDPVVITGDPVIVSLDHFIQETGWESDDEIEITVTVDANPPVVLLSTVGSDIDDLGIEGSWQTLSAVLSGNSAVLTASLDSNSGSEALYLDNVVFMTVPEPSALLVIGLLGLAIIGLRFRFG